MATLLKLYNFDDGAQGFTFTSGGKATGIWQSSGGNTLGCWNINSLGRNNTDTSYIELTTTWEALGVPSGAIINSITLPKIDWRCSFVNVSNGGGIGPFILMNESFSLQGTMFGQEVFTGVTTSYVTKNGSTVTVPSGIQASTSIVKIRLSILLDNASNASARTQVLIDNLGFTIDYTVLTYQGILKRWNGSAWVKAKLKYWNGSTWAQKKLKRWNGSAWVEVDTTGL